MKEDLIKKIKKSVRRNGFIYRQFVMMLAVVVVFTTTYALILPALTIDRDTAQQSPGMELEQEARQESGQSPVPETVAMIGDENGNPEPADTDSEKSSSSGSKHGKGVKL